MTETQQTQPRERIYRMLRVEQNVTRIILDPRRPGDTITVETKDHRGKRIEYSLQSTNKGRLLLI